MRQHRHLGIYAVVLETRGVLLVHKGRGPYTGLWDLPGGTPEHGESPEKTLARELREETGLALAGATLLAVLSRTLVHHPMPGEAEHLHHVGIVYRAAVHPGTLREGPDGHDALCARWFTRDALPALTPFAAEALALAAPDRQ